MRDFKRFLIVLPALVLIAVFVGVSGYLRYGTQWLEFGPADEAFEDGYRLERDGDLDGALAKYRTAFKSQLPAVRDAAGRAINRVTDKLHFWGAWHRDLRSVADWSLRIGLAWFL